MSDCLRIKIIALVGLICIISPLHAEETFEEIKKEAIEIAKEIVANDARVCKKKQLKKSLITFIKGLSDDVDNTHFLTAIKCFKKDSRASIKSLTVFLNHLIYRVKVVHAQCFVNLMKVLPEDYFSQHRFNWLRFSFKSGKIDYFKHLFEGCDGTFPQKKLMDLYLENSYRGLSLPGIQGFEECRELLRIRLNLKGDSSQSDEEDSESDADKLFIATSSSDEEFNGEQNQGVDCPDYSDEEDSESDAEKLFIDDSPSSDDDA